MRLWSTLARFSLLLCVLLLADFCLAQEAPLIKPPALDEAKTVKLPATVADVAIGGDGRYILYSFSSLKTVGVFDVNQAKLTHFIPAPDDKCKIAAGLTKLLITSGDGGTISRYDIATGEKELTKALDTPGPPTTLLLGSASQGPAFITAGERKSKLLVDLETLNTSPMKISGNKSFNRPLKRVSANGKTLTCWGTGSPSGLQTIVPQGDQWFSRYEHESVGMLLPRSDGKLIFTLNGIFNPLLRSVDAQDGAPQEAGFNALIPAVHGDVYLRTRLSVGRKRKSDPEPPKTISVYLHGVAGPLAIISNGESAFEADYEYSARDEMSLDKKCILVPRANLLVQLSVGGDELLLTPFDINEALAKSDLDFLLVQSSPVEEVTAGDVFQYQIDTLSKSGEVKYSLSSAPQGMSISESGLVTWPTSKGSPEKNSVIANVTDKSGQQIFHSFELSVAGASGRAALSSSNAKFSTATDVSIKSGPLSSADKERNINLPEPLNKWVVGGGGRFLLLYFKDLRVIGLFDVTKAKIVHFFPARADNIQMAAGANHLLVIDQDQGVVSRYNLTTLERELTKPVPFPGKIETIAMGNNSYGPVIARWSGTSGALGKASVGLIDLETLGKAEITWTQDRRFHISNRDQTFITTSADGQTFSVSGAGLFQIDGNRTKNLTRRLDQDRGSPKIFSADAQYVVSGAMIYNSARTPLTKDQNSLGNVVPALMGGYYLRLSKQTRPHMSRTENEPLDAKLYLFGNSQPIVNVNSLPVGMSSPDSKQLLTQPAWGINKNLMLIPDAKLIVCVSPSFDSLNLRYFDIDEALQASGIDYLYVTSNAPKTVTPGQRYEYQVETLSKSSEITYKLDKAPQGMTVSATGEVVWTPGNDFKSANERIFLTISDSVGQEVVHKFSIAIPKVAEMIAEERNVAAKEAAKLRRENRLSKTLKNLETWESIAAQHRRLVLDRLATSKSSESKVETSNQKNRPAPTMETWTDVSGKHDMEAEFVEVQDKSIVVLLSKDGSTKAVPLQRLTAEHIYRAVEYDLQRRSMIPRAEELPSEESLDPSVGIQSGGDGAEDVTDGDLRDIIESVERIIDLCKNEKDADAFLEGVYSPDTLAEMRGSGRFDPVKDEFQEVAVELLGGLVHINFSSARSRDGVVNFLNSTRAKKLRFKKSGRKWYLEN